MPVDDCRRVDCRSRPHEVGRLPLSFGGHALSGSIEQCIRSSRYLKPVRNEDPASRLRLSGPKSNVMVPVGQLRPPRTRQGSPINARSQVGCRSGTHRHPMSRWWAHRTLPLVENRPDDPSPGARCFSRQSVVRVRATAHATRHQRRPTRPRRSTRSSAMQIRDVLMLRRSHVGGGAEPARREELRVSAYLHGIAFSSQAVEVAIEDTTSWLTRIGRFEGTASLIQ